ncbi:MAG: hypothetical protein RMY29_024550 [Nostoc sp. CreGUA01]|nr:hypothetical protein [Nostoc sp. CreGUA01]
MVISILIGHWALGMGHGAWGNEGDEGDEGDEGENGTITPNS